MKLYSAFLLFIFCACYGIEGYAQQHNKTSQYVWKQLVERTVSTHNWMDAQGQRHEEPSCDSQMIKFLLSPVLSGKVKAYIRGWFEDDTDYVKFRKPITKEEFPLIINPPPTYDTDIIEDVTGELDTLVHLTAIYQLYTGNLSVTEQWVFDPVTRKTEVTIQWLTFSLVYLGGRDSAYKGETQLFKVKWSDLKATILQWSQTHKQRNFQSCWLSAIYGYHELRQPNLMVDTQARQPCIVSANTITLNNLRCITMPDTNQYGFLSLRGLHRANLCYDIYRNIKSGQLKAYADSGFRFTSVLSPTNIDFWHDDDTTLVEGHKGLDSTVIRKKEVYWYSLINYWLSERMVFDTQMGALTITITGVSPRFSGSGNMFLKKTDFDIFDEQRFPKHKQIPWVRYKDLEHKLAEYDQWHGVDNFSSAIWKSYFLPVNYGR